MRTTVPSQSLHSTKSLVTLPVERTFHLCSCYRFSCNLQQSQAVLESKEGGKSVQFVPAHLSWHILLCTLCVVYRVCEWAGGWGGCCVGGFFPPCLFILYSIHLFAMCAIFMPTAVFHLLSVDPSRELYICMIHTTFPNQTSENHINKHG